MQTLINKESFARVCDRFVLPRPETFIYRKEMGEKFSLPFGYPVIIKPAEQIAYWQNPFPGQKKVFKAETKAETVRIAERIYAAGYRGHLLVQDFIPGDDTRMRVLTGYSDRRGKVKLAALGHVLLEEHTPHGLGNHAVIINEENDELVRKVREFLDKIGYVGFFNIDLKYDERDGTYKFLELNARQGRSNYYVTGAGENLARWLAEDRVFEKEQEFRKTKDTVLWLMVPLRVAFAYVGDENLRKLMRRLVREGKVVNPLFYRGDRGLKRSLVLLKNHLSHFVKFARYYR
ncbi:MAG: ATP-grasp domain-containing protein, partial [Patescibacteria group bacterium]